MGKKQRKDYKKVNNYNKSIMKCMMYRKRSKLDYNQWNFIVR